MSTAEFDVVVNNSELEGVLNFRDVGRTINSFLKSKVLKEGLLFRSARLDDASLKDRERLKGDFAVQTVIDLRSTTEHLNASKKRQSDASIPALLKANPALAEPPQIPGVRYQSINLTSRRFELFLLFQLSWLNILKFLFLFLTGNRMSALYLLGSLVMKPRGLLRLGLDTLDFSKPQISSALFALLPSPHSSSSPTLIHCTQGKDRTGMVVLLALLIADVPPEAVEYDYSLTDAALQPEKEARLAEVREIGLSDEFVNTTPGLVSATIEYLDERYGGLESYLDGIGFGKAEREMLREALLC
ncbi:protein-tyrosine phosphatase-like protein [Podospora australis]|uniref:Protein-tyrosine phosphatase-like protein n=1 Tax=Podospora australis TaxID=1536484 RepID=A0AAN7APL4_9PEZI|nr:protein-tyrosine phosphatase-like protein [Podospora australis]